MQYLYPFASMSFAYPWALLAPFLLLFAYRLKRRVSAGLPYPDLGVIGALTPSRRQQLRLPILGTVLTLCILLLSIAAARPQKTSAVDTPEEASNIVLCLDVSRSMAARDFNSPRGLLPRLEGVKQVVSEFVSKTHGQRVGLVVFGTVSLLLAPLTTDYTLVQQMVDRIRLGIADDGTAIGDGLGLSLKRLRDIEGNSKAVVLLTDGVNNSGQVNPIKAAEVARDLGIKVHTVGIGSSSPVTIPLPGGIFSQQGLHRVEYDEQTLRKISELTGGVFFNANDMEGLSAIYEQIGRLERTRSDELGAVKVEELYLMYLLPGLLLYLCYLALSRTYFRVVP